MNPPSNQSRTRSLLLLMVLPMTILSSPVDQLRLGRKAADHSAKRENPWTWNKGTFPNPQKNPVDCRQPKASYICDPDARLTPDEAEQLNQLMTQSQINSRCLCEDDCSDSGSKGIVFGIAVMGNIFHALDANMDEVAHDFATYTMGDWSLGKCDNGVLLLLAIENKIFHIETGKAVKKVISEETVSAIFEDCVGHLKDGHIYQGLESIINSFRAKPALSSAYSDDDSTSQGSIGLTVGLVVAFAVLAGLFAAGVVVVRKRRQNTANNDKFMYDGSGSRPSSRNSSGKKDISGPIVKTPVVFPDAVYQPCSAEDVVASPDEEDDNENQYLQTLEENQSYEPGVGAQQPRELNIVAEEDSEINTDEQVPMAAIHAPNNTVAPSSNRDNILNVNT